jgi:hypothetical protein
MTTPPQAALLSDGEIIAIRKSAKPTDPAKAWGDTIALARGIEAAILAKLQSTQELVQSIPPGLRVGDSHMESLIEAAIQGHAGTRDAMRWLVRQIAKVDAEPGRVFPPRIMELLEQVADRNPGTTKGPWEDAQGLPMQDDADAAISWIKARSVATQELVQAGSASLLDGCKSIMDSIAVSSSVIEHNKQAEPVQAGELPTPFGYVSDGFQDGLHFQHKPWPEMHMLLNSVAQVYSAAQMRAALSARKPLPYDLICNAIDLADTESMKGDYMLDSSDCIAVVRTMQALIEINGIGLEVKP